MEVKGLEYFRSTDDNGRFLHARVRELSTGELLENYHHYHYLRDNITYGVHDGLDVLVAMLDTEIRWRTKAPIRMDVLLEAGNQPNRVALTTLSIGRLLDVAHCASVLQSAIAHRLARMAQDYENENVEAERGL